MGNAIVLTLGFLFMLNFASSKYIYKCECKTTCSADDIDSKITCGEYKWCCTRTEDVVATRLSTHNTVDDNTDSKLPRENDVLSIDEKNGRVPSREIPTVDPRLQATKNSVTSVSNTETYTPVEKAYQAMNRFWNTVPRARDSVMKHKNNVYLDRRREMKMLSARRKYMMENYKRFKWDSGAVQSPNDIDRELPVLGTIIEYPKDNAYQLFIPEEYVKDYFGRFGYKSFPPYMDKPALHDFLNGHLSRDPAGFQRYLDLPVDFRRPGGRNIADRFPPFKPQPNAPFKHLKDFDLNVDHKKYRSRNEPFIMLPNHAMPHRRLTPDGKEIITITEMPVHIKDDFEKPIHDRFEWTNNAERRDMGGGKI